MHWRIYSLAVIRFRAAAVSIAAGSDAGQRMRRLLVKRVDPLELGGGLRPWFAPIVWQVQPAAPVRIRGKTCSIEVAHRARANQIGQQK